MISGGNQLKIANFSSKVAYLQRRLSKNLLNIATLTRFSAESVGMFTESAVSMAPATKTGANERDGLVDQGFQSCIGLTPIPPPHPCETCKGGEEAGGHFGDCDCSKGGARCREIPKEHRRIDSVVEAIRNHEVQLEGRS